MSDENLLNETVHPANLTNRQRGHLAELAFMRKVASLGFSVAKPWGEGERYDLIVRVENVCWRVQVKSVLAKTQCKLHYRIKTSVGDTRKGYAFYSANEIDFLVAYVFPEDLWYVFPASVVEKRRIVCVTPRSKRSSFEKYREAWKLMRPAVPDGKSETAVATEAAASAKAGAT